MSSQTTTTYQQLVQANVERVSTGMFDLIDKLQKLPPGEQVASVAVLLVLITERFLVDPKDAMRVGANIVAADHYYDNGTRFAAAREYLKQEVPL